MSLGERIDHVSGLVSQANAFLFGTKENPTWLRRTFGKAAEWVIIGLVVLLLLSVMQSCERHASKAAVSLLSLSPLSQPVAEKTPTPTKKAVK